LTTDPDLAKEWNVVCNDAYSQSQISSSWPIGWVEYGLKQSKNELGWADFRMTSYAQIERWWEIVMSAYLLVSLHTSLLHQPQLQPSTQPAAQPQAIALKLVQHPDWNQASSWKQVLNNLRLVIQPSVILNLLQPWLNLFPIPRLSAGLSV